MKTINNSMLRSIFGLVLGLVLILWPEQSINYLVITIGVLFIIPGLLSMIGYFSQSKRQNRHSMFPIEGAGSFLFGLWLVIMPSFFVSILMYILGFILLLGGVQQISNLAAARKWTSVSLGFYVVPVLILISGVVVLFNPFSVASGAFMLLGISSFIYGVSELINWFRFKRNKEIN